MSVEDYLRELRDDIVDSTRKMMEEAPVSGSELKQKKVKMNDSVAIDDEQRSTTTVVQEIVAAEGKGDAVAKVAMEFVQLSIETKPEQNVEIDSRQSDVVKDNPEESSSPPLPEITQQADVKKSKKDVTRKDKKHKDASSKTAKSEDGKKKEKILKEKKKKEAKGLKFTSASHGEIGESSDENQKHLLETSHRKLINLQSAIKEIETQICTIKFGFKQQGSKAIEHRAEADTDSMGMSKKEKKPKDKKPKSVRTGSEPSKTDQAEHKYEKKNTINIDTDGEKNLLLKLFTLSSSQRRKYIEKRGIELGVLDPHPYKRHVVLVNERVQHLATTLFFEAKRYIHPDEILDESLDPPVVPEASKVKQEPKSFEEQVNHLLNMENGKPCAIENYNPELMLTSARDEAQMILQDRLESFVARLVENNVGYLMEGLLRINVRNNIQSFVNDAAHEGNVYINSILLRRCAMEGDFVRVFVINKPVPTGSTAIASNTETDCLQDTPTSIDGVTDVEEKPAVSPNNVGFVVKILEKRNNRQCVGKFLPSTSGKKHYRTFMPRDKRIPPVRVFKQDWPNALIEEQHVKPTKECDKKSAKQSDPVDVTEVLYQAEIIEWQDEIPIGTILKSIGKCGVLEVENESILVEYDLDVTPYGEDILAQLPSVPYSIPPEEMARRIDLRGECIFTIDPATARDLDDALSCKVLQNGNFEIGVHISDVTYFLRERSELDELVKLRATSIYMVDTVYHMLPKQLCNTCSLLPGQDKLAFSVIWEMLPDGTVVSTRFARSVINSCAQLSYEHAQMMLDSPKGDNLEEDLFPEILHGYSVGSLANIVNQLQSIAVKLRQRRMDDGCLKINQPKLTFRLDPATGRPIMYGVYKLRASNEMIEDFMLLANASVAKAIHDAFPSLSLLRNHKPPAENMMKKLVQTLANHGHKFSYASSKAIRESMETIIAGAEHPDAACSVLNILLSKPMTRALYYCSAFASGPDQCRHYALAIPLYTHFTSPIRRYADCLVHRVLAAMLGIDEEPKRSPDELQKLATICNEKKYNAKLAGDASSMLYYRHWLRATKQHETVAAVLGYGTHYVDLVLIDSGIVVKATTKKISAVASVVFKPTEPVGILKLIPKDVSIEPVILNIFTKVRVTIKLVHDAITVCSILPMGTVTPKSTTEACEVVPTECTENNVEANMKSARVY